MSAFRILIGSWVLLAVLMLGGPALAFTGPHPMDVEELSRVRAANPEAAALFDSAESLLRKGDLRAAAKALADARAAYPNSYLIGRRQCQVLTELGQRDEALDACSAAMTQGTAMDARALVGALMATETPATPRDLVQAAQQARAAHRLLNQTFSAGAFCEIGHHIGDQALLNLCLRDLETIAPTNPETLRWRSVRPQVSEWPLWLGWAAIVGVTLFTLLHAARSWLRSPARKAPSVAVAIAFVIFSASGAVRAQDDEAAPTQRPPHWQLSTFPIDWDNPEGKIPSIEERNNDPLQFGYFLQDLNAEALKAERVGDWASAVKFWRADAKAVPDMAVAFSHACKGYQMLGNIEQALEFCGNAVNREGSTIEDYLRYAELATGRSAPLSPVDVQDLDAMVNHLQGAGETAAASVIECREGVKLDDAVRLNRCTKVLAKSSPNDPHTLTFFWSYAMLRKDYKEAKRLLDVMAKNGMAPKALALARETTARESAWWRRAIRDWRIDAAVALLLVAGAAVFFWSRRKGTRQTSAGSGAAAASA